MPCGEEQKKWRTAKRSGGTPSSLQCEIYTLFAASQCLSLMLCSSVCKLYTYPHTFRLRPEPAVTACGVDKNSPEACFSFRILFTLLRPIQRIDNAQHKKAWQNVCVRFYTTCGIDA